MAKKLPHRLKIAKPLVERHSLLESDMESADMRSMKTYNSQNKNDDLLPKEIFCR